MLTISLPTDEARDYVGELPDDVEVLVWDGKGDRPPGAERVEFFVGKYNDTPPTADALADLESLRVIQVTSAGVDPWLPVVPDGVLLCNGRGVHGGSTAELAVAGLLAILCDLPGFWAAQAARTWDTHDTAGLTGRKVLVLGTGDIGVRVATAARAFDADTTMVARTARDGVRPLADLPQLVPDHDVVVIALPLTEQTRGLVDRQFLSRMPDGAVLVNIARGPIVDTDALLSELTAERLHAFLDVTEPEPLPADHPLWAAPNLMLTPHVGGGTRGWVSRAYSGLVRAQILRMRAGEALANQVTAGY